MVERFHCQLKASLATRLKGPGWMAQLPWVMFGIRAAHKNDVGALPAEMVYGTQLHLPGQFQGPTRTGTVAVTFLDDLRRAMTELHPTPTVHHRPNTPPQPHIPAGLQDCRMVFIQKDGQIPPLSFKYEGLYEVVERVAKFFKVRIGSKTNTVSIDRLKPVTLEENTGPAQVPR